MQRFRDAVRPEVNRVFLAFLEFGRRPDGKPGAGGDTLPGATHRGSVGASSLTPPAPDPLSHSQRPVASH